MFAEASRGHALTIYPVSQKHYETVCEVNARENVKYTDGSGKHSKETELSLSVGARMENTGREQVIFERLRFLLTPSMEEGLEKAAEEIGRNMSARLFMPQAITGAPGITATRTLTEYS